MSGKTNKLISQESRKDYGKESAEEAKALSQGDNEFDRADDEFEETRPEEKVFDRTRTEESAARARSQRARIMAGYLTGTANNPKEEEEEINTEGNCKQPLTNPIGGSRGWGKKSWQGHSWKEWGNLSGYATGLLIQHYLHSQEEAP